MNAGEACAAVMQRGFDYLSNPQLMLMLNTAKDVFEDMYEWPWLLVSYSGRTPLVLIPPLKFVQSVFLTGTNVELLGLDARQIHEGVTDPAQSGTPEYWYLFGENTLLVWPGLGADVGVWYTMDSPPLVNPGDTPLIPARYHHLWIDLAVVEAYKDSDNYAAAGALRQDVGASMQDVIGRYETRNRQHSPLISIRAGSEDE